MQCPEAKNTLMERMVDLGSSDFAEDSRISLVDKIYPFYKSPWRPLSHSHVFLRSLLR